MQLILPVSWTRDAAEDVLKAVRRPKSASSLGQAQMSYSLFTLVLWMTFATFFSLPICCSFSDRVYAARIASNWKQIMSSCPNSLPVNNTFWLRCGMTLTTAHRWVAKRESKAYLPVILHKESKQAAQLHVSGWKMLKILL